MGAADCVTGEHNPPPTHPQPKKQTFLLDMVKWFCFVANLIRQLRCSGSRLVGTLPVPQESPLKKAENAISAWIQNSSLALVF